MKKLWTCGNCGKTYSESPEGKVCLKCGIVLATKGTAEKHKYLHDLCVLNKYELIIDACAGSGKLLLSDGKLIKGSPLVIEQLADDSTDYFFIDYNPKTVEILKQFVQKTPICADCNEVLPNLINEDTKTLVYLDPFGYGIPPIKRELVLDIAQTPNIDLLHHFSWRICREIGYAKKYLNDEDDKRRKTAESFKESLGIYWGSLDCFSWPSSKTLEYAERYANELKEHNQVHIIGIPQYSSAKSFYLILATKFNAPKIGLHLFL